LREKGKKEVGSESGRWKKKSESESGKAKSRDVNLETKGAIPADKNKKV